MRLTGDTHANERGATLVEFAIVVPLLFLLLFGIVESARMVTEFTTLRTAAREGARFATTVDDSDGVPNYADCAGIIAATQAKAVVGELSAIQVTWDPPSGGPFTCSNDSKSNPDPEDIVAGTFITVKVEGEFNSVIPLIGAFFDNMELDSEQTRQVFKGVIDEDET